MSADNMYSHRAREFQVRDIGSCGCCYEPKFYDNSKECKLNEIVFKFNRFQLKAVLLKDNDIISKISLTM